MLAPFYRHRCARVHPGEEDETRGRRKTSLFGACPGLAIFALDEKASVTGKEGIIILIVIIIIHCTCVVQQ